MLFTRIVLLSLIRVSLQQDQLWSEDDCPTSSIPTSATATWSTSTSSTATSIALPTSASSASSPEAAIAMPTGNVAADFHIGNLAGSGNLELAIVTSSLDTSTSTAPAAPTSAPSSTARVSQGTSLSLLRPSWASVASLGSAVGPSASGFPGYTDSNVTYSSPWPSPAAPSETSGSCSSRSDWAWRLSALPIVLQLAMG